VLWEEFYLRGWLKCYSSKVETDKNLQKYASSVIQQQQIAMKEMQTELLRLRSKLDDVLMENHLFTSRLFHDAPPQVLPLVQAKMDTHKERIRKINLDWINELTREIVHFAIILGEKRKKMKQFSDAEESLPPPVAKENNMQSVTIITNYYNSKESPTPSSQQESPTGPDQRKSKKSSGGNWNFFGKFDLRTSKLF
jgi:hypothetical protein